MPEKYYPPRKLPRTREYPGYQFYCTLQKQDDSAERCFCFAVLCIIDWLKQRLRETDIIPDQIARLPGRQDADQLKLSELESFTINSGFSAYVVSLPGHGVWTLRLKEPDSDADQRKAVPGRFFATNVGLHIINDREVELGIRIDVTDPEEVPEVDYAFRPRFVRSLFEAPDITLTRLIDLPYDKAIEIENEDRLRLLRTLLDSSENSLPVILITQAVRLSNGSPDVALGKGPVASRIFNPSSPFDDLFPSVPVVEKYYPFNAGNTAAHNFGYAVTFRIPESMHDSLVRRLKKEYTPGDILFVEPKRFGGRIHVLEENKAGAVEEVWRLAHCYSKNRRYIFGDVQFEFDARGIESRELIDRIRVSGEMKAEEKLARLNQEIDELQEESESQVRKINELKEQLLSEYKRGEEAEKARSGQLLADYEKLEEDLRIARSRNMLLTQDNKEARAIRTAVEAFRNMPELPRTNADVINYFRNVYGDRIVFTERGIKTGSKCDIRPEGLWYYLYHMAKSLFEIHHEGMPDVENEFLHATGITVSMHEGSQSHKDNEVMDERMDFFEGKEYSMEPHVKLAAQKTGLERQRIYYCYDREIDRIIIGKIGGHLKTAGTVHLN